jgi:hypothetical protein
MGKPACAPRAGRLRPCRVRHRHVAAARAQAVLELGELPHGGGERGDEVSDLRRAGRGLIASHVARVGFRTPVLRPTERSGGPEHDDLDVVNGARAARGRRRFFGCRGSPWRHEQCERGERERGEHQRQRAQWCAAAGIHGRHSKGAAPPSPSRRRSSAANSKRALSAGSARETRNLSGPSSRNSRVPF